MPAGAGRVTVHGVKTGLTGQEPCFPRRVTLVETTVGHPRRRKPLVFQGRDPVNGYLAGATGCVVGTGERFALASPPAGQSLIYHYHLAKYAGDAIHYNVYANDEPLVAVGIGGYYPQIASPGRMTYKTLTQLRFAGVALVPILISNALAKVKPVFELETKPGNCITVYE